MKVNVLDKGFIDCQEIMGNQLTIVNAARVSFGKQKTVFEPEDRRLLAYLLRHKHYSPFRHVFLRFHIKAPEMVMRQWYKHVVGIEWTPSAQPFQLHGWNEISGRYIEWNECYIPPVWRKQSTSSKQGSDGVLSTEDDKQATLFYQDALEHITQCYQQLIDMGVAKELARSILPMSTYTECIWTVSLQAALNFLQLRLDTHAQWEIREYALNMERIVREAFPDVVDLYFESMETPSLAL